MLGELGLKSDLKKENDLSSTVPYTNFIVKFVLANNEQKTTAGVSLFKNISLKIKYI